MAVGIELAGQAQRTLLQVGAQHRVDRPGQRAVRQCQVFARASQRTRTTGHDLARVAHQGVPLPRRAENVMNGIRQQAGLRWVRGVNRLSWRWWQRAHRLLHPGRGRNVIVGDAGQIRVCHELGRDGELARQ